MARIKRKLHPPQTAVTHQEVEPERSIDNEDPTPPPQKQKKKAAPKAVKKKSLCNAAKAGGDTEAGAQCVKARKYRVTYSEVDIPNKFTNDKWGPCYIKDTPDLAQLEDAIEDTDGAAEALLWDEHELSITITDCGRDLDILSALPRLTVWCERRTTAYLFAAERGFSERNLHLQGIARLHLRTEKQQGAAQMCQKEIIKALGWDSKSKPKNARVMVRFLRHEGLHTWIGMVGYCIKNETADDYTEISGGVTEEDKRLGRQLYLQLGAGDLKNKTALCPRNLFNKVG